MNQLQKYSWLIDVISRFGKISHKELSDLWERDIEKSEGKPLHRATFNHWRDAILDQFNVRIGCERKGGYRYYIENPEEISRNKLKKWMLDSYAVCNAVGENMALKDRIIVDEIPSGRNHLTSIITAMKENRVVMISYRPFDSSRTNIFPIEPYCLKLFENRWYVLAHNNRDEIKIYSLDRMEEVSITNEIFKMPEDFSSSDFFSSFYGIVVGSDLKPMRIIVRAHYQHRHYLKTLPLHHSQRMIEDCGEYADFEFFLVPTYDFIMKLLQAGAMAEVVYPPEFRKEVKRWISEMSELYSTDSPIQFLDYNF